MRLKQRDLLLKMKYVFHFISNFKVFLEDVPNEDQDAEELINIWQNLGISDPNIQEKKKRRNRYVGIYKR